MNTGASDEPPQVCVSGIGVVKTANSKESGSAAMMLSVKTPRWISVSFFHLKLSETRRQNFSSKGLDVFVVEV